MLGGWQTSGTYEYQPGALLDWDNIFFYGDFEDIAIDNPQIALQPDGTIDPTKRWFNIDAGFERDPARQPAAFQKRVFPFRVDGVRGFNFTQLNLSFARRFDSGQPPHAAVPRGHAERAEPSAVGKPEHESAQHELRSGHDDQRVDDAIHQFWDEGQFLDEFIDNRQSEMDNGKHIGNCAIPIGNSAICQSNRLSNWQIVDFDWQLAMSLPLPIPDCQLSINSGQHRPAIRQLLDPAVSVRPHSA